MGIMVYSLIPYCRIYIINRITTTTTTSTTSTTGTTTSRSCRRVVVAAQEQPPTRRLYGVWCLFLLVVCCSSLLGLFVRCTRHGTGSNLRAVIEPSLKGCFRAQFSSVLRQPSQNPS